MRFRISFGVRFCFIFVAVIILEQSTAVSPATENVVSTATNVASSEEIDDPMKWPVRKFIKTMKDNLNILTKNLMPVMLKASSNVSPDCMSSFMTLAGGVRKLKEWAVKMVDASGKIPTGVLEGTFISMGSYDECLDVIAMDERTPPKQLYRGQYCLVSLRPPTSMLGPFELVANASGIKDFHTTFLHTFADRESLQKVVHLDIGICLPSTCSADDLNALLKALFASNGMSAYVDNCHVKGEPIKIDAVQITIISGLSMLAVLIVTGTITDLLHRQSEASKSQLANRPYYTLINKLKVFSAFKSLEKFLIPPRSERTFGMLTGLRVFSITWVIIGHTFFMPDILFFLTLKDVFPSFEFKGMYLIVESGALAVDTFFIISGFLITYLTWKIMERQKGKLNPLTFIIKRALRMLPAVLFATGIVLILPLFGDGPVWDTTWREYYETCRENWWYNILFIQNFLDTPENICLRHSWYLAASMQVHVILYFLLVLLYWKPVIGIGTTLSLILAGMVAVVVVSVKNGFGASFMYNYENLGTLVQYIAKVYTQTYSHIGPFCIGVLLAYFILKHPGAKLQSKKWRITGWICATIVALTLVFGQEAFDGSSYLREPPLRRMFYVALYRNVWSMCVAWVIYDCWASPKNVVNSLLSWKLFFYLDRLTFMVYILHPLVMAYHVARGREVTNSDKVDMVYLYIGHLVFVYLISFVIHILVEQPVSELIGLLFSSKPKKQENVDMEVKTNGQA